MGKNHAEEVAKLLGVEIGEVFRIEDTRMGDYKFNKNLDLLHFNISWSTWFPSRDYETFAKLIRGELKIIKKSYKPKDGDTFWLVDPDGTIDQLEWEESAECYALYKVGNCFRVGEIDEHTIKKIVDFYDNDDVINKEGN